VPDGIGLPAVNIDLLGNEPAIIIGLMSGTSADGIDAAVMQVGGVSRPPAWKLLAHLAAPWSTALRGAILGACRPDAPLQHICALDVLLGDEFARVAQYAATAAGLPMSAVTAIASHGQTVWHQPEPMEIGGGRAAGTVQLGEPAVIAARTGRVVVADFRPADMAVGGQGAPLVPFADCLLFADIKETRVVQNIGGIANATLLPAGGALQDVVAFDSGPGNMVMDALALRCTDGRLACDLDGAIAASGQADAALLAELLEHPYFARRPPKSTGREQFGGEYADAVYSRAVELGLSSADLLATAAALTIETIGRAYSDFFAGFGRIDTVILGGGGARNPVLVAGLRARLAPARVTSHVEFGMPDEAKEAAAFALLGYSTLRGIASNVPSATGAARPAVLGKICLPPL